jgi:hypothetical protein
MPIPHLPPINPHCHKCYFPREEEGEAGGKKGGGGQEEEEKAGLPIEDNRAVGIIPCHLKCDTVRERGRERGERERESERARERERERERERSGGRGGGRREGGREGEFMRNERCVRHSLFLFFGYGWRLHALLLTVVRAHSAL